ncbi:MAG: bifunctional (p)ppGpp synthetase/guanosine-3',5'-bis(diphosphate) 3'-pyrophosphohydrolase, partial [Deinococcota bacterium]
KAMDALFETLQRHTGYLGGNDKVRLAAAYTLAEEAHRGVLRKSGEPFISHPVAVANILAEMHMDADALIAGLLHDTVEDTDVTFEQIESGFGEMVRRIVEGETKISKLSVRVYEDEQSENLRQMLLAMVGDVRIILVKLADRLHNMRTLGSMPPHKQLKIARETLEIFSPLAHRLGINHIKTELEELSFRYLEPAMYESLRRRVRTHHAEREAYVARSMSRLEERMNADGFKVEISGRSKNLYSVHRKMQRDGRTIDQIFDLMAIRTIIDAEDAQGEALCYRVLGLVHSLWTPIPGRFKDYIAAPKHNGYQSLHTTVIGFMGQPIEVQIRTRSMHEIAEYGVAAHWAYKQGLQDVKEVEKRVEWMKQLLEVDDSTESAGAFVETVKEDLLSERVFVFTPAGDVINLPHGATPIDFAYHVHTQVGHRCIGARVNGEIVPFNYTLSNGDRVEIITNRSNKFGPSADWLQIAETRSAKQKIRHYFRQKEREGILTASRQSLERAMRRKQLPLKELLTKPQLEAAAKSLLMADSADDLLLAIHSKRLTIKQVIETLHPESSSKKPDARLKTPITSRQANPASIYLDDLDVPSKLAMCCSPVRGDDVIGYITRGRGVSVHRIDCPNARRLMQKEAERIVNVFWEASADELYPVDFEIIGVDRPALLQDILAVIARMNKSAMRVTAGVRNNTQAQIHFRVDVKDQQEIEHIKESVGKIEDVTQVYRAKPGLKT